MLRRRPSKRSLAGEMSGIQSGHEPFCFAEIGQDRRTYLAEDVSRASDRGE